MSNRAQRAEAALVCADERIGGAGPKHISTSPECPSIARLRGADDHARQNVQRSEYVAGAARITPYLFTLQ